MSERIYLDNNATTRMASEVAEAMSKCLAESLANPASSHREGQRARRQLEQARETIADSIGALLDVHPPDRIVFTSGATEANHLAIRGLAERRPGAVVVSALEHPSVRGAADQLAAQGREVRVVGATGDGVVDLEQLESALTPPVAVVAIMLANNETGAVQPIAEAARLCHAASAPLHCDAVQGLGKLPLDFRQLDVDTMSLNAHKIHGPVGVGALVIRSKVEVSPLIRGGGQQLATRPGTESVPLAVGFAAAVKLWLENADENRAQLARQRDRLEEILQGCSRAVINAASVQRTPQTINVSFVGLNRQELLMALDLAGLACSTGSACASGSSEPSPVLIGMGLPEENVEGALRLSLGLDTTDEEVEEAGQRILKVVA